MPIDLNNSRRIMPAWHGRRSIEGKYKEELDDLLGLSAEKISEVCPNLDLSRITQKLIPS